MEIGIWKNDYEDGFLFGASSQRGLLVSMYTITDIKKRALCVVVNGIVNDDVPSFACSEFLHWLLLACPSLPLSRRVSSMTYNTK
jgi:hypothetical protein